MKKQRNKYTPLFQDVEAKRINMKEGTLKNRKVRLLEGDTNKNS
jgi:hypothetical protein